MTVQIFKPTIIISGILISLGLILIIVQLFLLKLKRSSKNILLIGLGALLLIIGLYLLKKNLKTKSDEPYPQASWHGLGDGEDPGIGWVL